MRPSLLLRFPSWLVGKNAIGLNGSAWKTSGSLCDPWCVSNFGGIGLSSGLLGVRACPWTIPQREISQEESFK